MENKKESFFKTAIASIKDFDKYQDFATENVSRGIQYFLKIFLLFSLAIAILFCIKIGIHLNQGISYLKDQNISIVFENNSLSVNNEEPIIIENEKIFPGIVIIDTSDIDQTKKEEYDKKAQLYSTGVFILKDRIEVRNSLAEAPIIRTYEDIAKEYQIQNFNQEQLISYIEQGQWMGYLVILIFGTFSIFLLYATYGLLDCIAPIIMGYFAARITGLKLKIGSLFNITVHALTLPILLNIIYIGVNLFTGFYMQYFYIVYTTITYIYIITAILLIRSNLIKQQIQLMKIIEEQEKVKEELKQQEEEPKEKKEDKKEEKQEEQEKKEEKKKEDGKIGNEAKGEA